MSLRSEENVRVVISDPHPLIRESIKTQLIDNDASIEIQEAEDAHNTMFQCRTFEPKLLLLDLGTGDTNSRQVLIKVTDRFPDIKIVAMAANNLTANAQFAITNGAVAFVPKHSKPHDFVFAALAAVNGFSYLPVEFIVEFLDSRRQFARTGNMFGLSPRELEVLAASDTGSSTKEIAEQLDISTRTVETHRNNIYRKTDCHCLNEVTEMLAS